MDPANRQLLEEVATLDEDTERALFHSVLCRYLAKTVSDLRTEELFSFIEEWLNESDE